MHQAAPSFGQPQPISRLVRAGRPQIRAFIFDEAGNAAISSMFAANTTSTSTRTTLLRSG
eukprot:scaffold35182_cov56-Phaeocystis_antarctica.AAC.3